jgi:predicted metal-binding protein
MRYQAAAHKRVQKNKARGARMHVLFMCKACGIVSEEKSPAPADPPRDGSKEAQNAYGRKRRDLK